VIGKGHLHKVWFWCEANNLDVRSANRGIIQPGFNPQSDWDGTVLGPASQTVMRFPPRDLRGPCRVAGSSHAKWQAAAQLFSFPQRARTHPLAAATRCPLAASR
jgi:hypothetical protein